MPLICGAQCQHSLSQKAKQTAIIAEKLYLSTQTGSGRLSLLIAALRAAPQEVLAIGDRDLDILPGKAAGMMTCRCGATTRPVGAVLGILSLEELFPTY